MSGFTFDSELYHHGILGMKWGIRRFQNADGSLTPAGRKRYLSNSGKEMEHLVSDYRKLKTHAYGPWGDHDGNKSRELAAKVLHQVLDEDAEYQRLIKNEKYGPNEKALRRGEKVIRSILGEAGNKQIYGEGRGDEAYVHISDAVMLHPFVEKERPHVLSDKEVKKVKASIGHGYLNPSKADIKTGKAKAREKVGDEYSKEYWKAIKNGMPKNEYSAQGRRLWNKYKDAYAKATLEDLGIEDSPAARKQVLNLIAEVDPNFYLKNI